MKRTKSRDAHQTYRALLAVAKASAWIRNVMCFDGYTADGPGCGKCGPCKVRRALARLERVSR